MLVILALLPAVLSGWLHPRRPIWTSQPPEIARVELATVEHWQGPVLWVDARTASAYARSHVPGAVPLSESDWDNQLPGFLERWRPGVRIVVYCNAQACSSSEEVARRLKRELNLDDVFVLRGGWAAWEQANP